MLIASRKQKVTISIVEKLPTHTIPRTPPMRTLKLLAATALLGSTSLFAQTTVLNWDADGAAGIGGTGAWNTTSTLWNTATSGAANTIWTTGNGSSGFAASFAGTAGTVTVQSGGITTGVLQTGDSSALNFNVSGYTLSGGKISVDNTGGGNDKLIVHIESGTAGTTTINNAIDLTPAFLSSNSFTRVSLARVNDSTINFNGALNTIGTTGGTHNLDFMVASATGVTVNLNGVIGDAASASATTALRLGGSTGANIANITTRLNAVNTYTGSTIASGKVLIAVDSIGTGGSGGSLGANGTQSVTFGTAGTASLLTDAAVTVNNPISISSITITAITIGGNSAHASTFAGAVDLSANNSGLTNAKIALQAVTGGTVTFSGLINDGASSIGVDKMGAGTVILSRSAGNTFDGPVNVVDGTLLVNNTTSGSGTGTGAITVGSVAGSLTGATANGTLSGSRLATVLSTSGMVVGQTITGTGIAAGTYVEQIRTAGTIILSQNANSSTNNQTFSLAASNGVLGGNGTISGATTVLSGSTIAPGASAGTIGTLTFDGTPAGAVATFASGATFTFDLNATTVTGDRIALLNGASGDFVFNSNVINFTLAGSLLNGQTYLLFDGTANDQFTGLTLTGPNVTGGLSFTGLSGSFQANSYLTLINGDIVLTAVIPEPSTWALLAGGLTVVVTLRRRRA